ncbi:unnamed protein product [Nesidiocoris tenuis]|uniref:Uncharacterized protein n=1 Tax=Nesidiocoris tenuis TaxID=355587 RepID=A0A6H5G1W7_9HEMI|nr:unnamed protein product [Nesidiocoris tenuis]
MTRPGKHGGLCDPPPAIGAAIDLRVGQGGRSGFSYSIANRFKWRINRRIVGSGTQIFNNFFCTPYADSSKTHRSGSRERGARASFPKSRNKRMRARAVRDVCPFRAQGRTRIVKQICSVQRGYIFSGFIYIDAAISISGIGDVRGKRSASPSEVVHMARTRSSADRRRKEIISGIRPQGQ